MQHSQCPQALAVSQIRAVTAPMPLHIITNQGPFFSLIFSAFTPTIPTSPSLKIKMRPQEPTLPSISLVLAQHAASPTPTYFVFPWTYIIQNPNPTGQIIVNANPALTAVRSSCCDTNSCRLTCGISVPSSSREKPS
ncbi:hypothetical protein B0H10DRAFT_464213 [Mycena sp. CBHHK59/15]|nr:hypothetical protein B0H10DRAFT_464213 [Mycena sp. CBHHK59/15]